MCLDADHSSANDSKQLPVCSEDASVLEDMTTDIAKKKEAGDEE